jgi:hypothetical protein
MLVGLRSFVIVGGRRDARTLYGKAVVDLLLRCLPREQSQSFESWPGLSVISTNMAISVAFLSLISGTRWKSLSIRSSCVNQQSLPIPIIGYCDFLPKPGDVVFLELDLSRTVVETEIWVRTSLQHQAFPASSDGGGEKSAEAISCSRRPQINLRSGANVQSAWDEPYNQAQPLAPSVMRLSYANIVRPAGVNRITSP